MLKQLMLIKKIEQRKAALAVLLEQETALATRGEELEAAIEEAKTDEEIAAVEEGTANLEKDQAELADKKSKLEGEIAELENELEQLKSKAPSKGTLPAQPPARGQAQGGEVRMKRGFFAGMNRGEVDALIAREEVREFLQRTRELGAQKRSVTGGDLLIPDVMLGLLRDNIALSSKLITKVNYKPLKGTARQNVTGTVPEAVWTEMVGALNELEISFNQVEVDGYKVGGFIPIPNSTLQDSDINLASEIMAQLSKAIGVALDKAILYGSGTKQPMGIVTRLAQESKPAGYPADAPDWKDLRTTHMSKVNTTGAALIGSIITAFGACKNDFSDGRKFFAMNSVTYAYLVSTLLNFNAAGALATGMSNQMPILGGDIVILDFISDYDIVGGYGDLYLLVEREGTVLAASEHVKFIEDQTVFKGLARYDGLPVIAEGFFVININNQNAATSKTFPLDTANPVLGELTITSTAHSSTAGSSDITIDGEQEFGTFFGYKIGTKAAKVEYGTYHTGFTPITFTAGAATIADLADDDDGKILTVVEFYYGIAIAAGTATLKVKKTTS
ncbi:MAG: phage major capsid protein [bacterium]|jgi:HK97 family phage major capsid protein